jgi:hypothetical protein
LLALQYIPNPENLPEVDHFDKNRLNNDLANLRWVDKITQNNNKSNNLTDERKAERVVEIREYQRVWAENNRRENGVEPKEKIKTANEAEYKKLKQREYRSLGK